MKVEMKETWPRVTVDINGPRGPYTSVTNYSLTSLGLCDSIFVGIYKICSQSLQIMALHRMDSFPSPPHLK